ncbi:hypothetical protein [Brevundimonas sp.]|jgi:hypothetical protein|uniref:hypothetical protein n=1 Tax=Brevundimonas sp. TaxID=1871086 RepID=UPI0025B84E69|nr:hypothetical protein [Brevundimonas sp.]
MKWALTVLLVLSAPLALYCGPTAFDLPHYIGQGLSQGNLLTSGGLWNLFLRLIPIFWLLSAGWVIILWRRGGSVRPPRPLLSILVGGLLLMLTFVTVFFVYVIWAWSQM